MLNAYCIKRKSDGMRICNKKSKGVKIFLNSKEKNNNKFILIFAPCFVAKLHYHRRGTGFKAQSGSFHTWKVENTAEKVMFFNE